MAISIVNLYDFIVRYLCCSHSVACRHIAEVSASSIAEMGYREWYYHKLNDYMCILLMWMFIRCATVFHTQRNYTIFFYFRVWPDSKRIYSFPVGVWESSRPSRLDASNIIATTYFHLKSIPWASQLTWFIPAKNLYAIMDSHLIRKHAGDVFVLY